MKVDTNRTIFEVTLTTDSGLLRDVAFAKNNRDYEVWSSGTTLGGEESDYIEKIEIKFYEKVTDLKKSFKL